MNLTLLISPFVIALLAALLPSNRWRPWLPPIGALLHFVLTLRVVFGSAELAIGPWIGLDPAGKLVLLLISTLFLITSIYLIRYLKFHPQRENRVFVACLLCTLGSMTMVTWSQHLGLMWVSIEATALCTAPLIYFNKTTRSIEATWKYLLIGFVGIALALLGTFCLAYSALHAGLDPSLSLSELLQDAPLLSKPWLHVAFVLMLVGYGVVERGFSVWAPCRREGECAVPRRCRRRVPRLQPRGPRSRRPVRRRIAVLRRRGTTRRCRQHRQVGLRRASCRPR